MTVLLLAMAISAGPIDNSHPNMAQGVGRIPCDRECRVRRRWRRTVRPHRAKLNRIAACESGGRWHINGMFDGGLQFHPDTWHAAGGSGYAYQASKLEQMYRAVIWHDMIGGTWVTTAGWPRCGYA